MARSFTKTSLSDAVGRLAPGMKVLLPPGCGEPTALVGEICRQSDRLTDLTLMGGVHLGDYRAARPEHASLAIATWQMSPRLEEARRRGRVTFLPIRYFDVVTEFREGGRWAPDCVIAHCAPPDARGYVSLGVSVSVTLPAARLAPLVIAQVNPAMPRTLGNAFLHASQIDLWVDHDEPLLEYPPTPVGDVERAIGRHVASLVPDGATVQIGIGAIPQAVLESLGDHRDLALHSLLVDAGVTLIERGVVTAARKRLHRGRIDVGEVMGTRRVFDFVHENPFVNMETSELVHDPDVVARFDRFVAVNSALEIDLTGQVTAETLGGRQVAGIGGQFELVFQCCAIGRRLTDRAAARRRRGGHHTAFPRGLGRDGVRRRAASRPGSAGAGRGADGRGPPPVP